MTRSTTSCGVLADSKTTDHFKALSEALGYWFEDESLLTLALTHRSYCAEHDNIESNERLEFLGDAVLGLAMTDTLFVARPEQPEGDLAKARAEVVSAPSLARTARELGLGAVLLLGKGEELSGGRDKDSILADAMEAVIAAVYLDAGWQRARELVDTHLADVALNAQTAPGQRDYKTRLQERAAELDIDPPSYDMDSMGPDHDRTFVSTVTVGSAVGTGQGSSKKQAQQQAAERALALLEEKYVANTAVSGQGEHTAATVPSGGTS